MYQSGPRIFSAMESIASSPNVIPRFIDRALVALGGAIWEAQNIQSNLVAESVITFGVKAFHLQPYEQNETYLQLYEAMLQGIFEYEATYSRLIYSTFDNPPRSCLRTVNGSVSYLVVGWIATPGNGSFLIPMTIVNVVSLIILLKVMFNAKSGGDQFDPLQPNSLLSASADVGKGRNQWEDKVEYRLEERNEKVSGLA
jgi:hypothetical protein